MYGSEALLRALLPRVSGAMRRASRVRAPEHLSRARADARNVWSMDAARCIEMSGIGILTSNTLPRRALLHVILCRRSAGRTARRGRRRSRRLWRPRWCAWRRTRWLRRKSRRADGHGAARVSACSPTAVRVFRPRRAACSLALEVFALEAPLVCGCGAIASARASAEIGLLRAAAAGYKRRGAVM